MLSAAVPGGVRFGVGADDALERGWREGGVRGCARVEMSRTTVSFETFPDSGSCVHLDKSADFLESTAAYVAARDA